MQEEQCYFVKLVSTRSKISKYVLFFPKFYAVLNNSLDVEIYDYAKTCALHKNY